MTGINQITCPKCLAPLDEAATQCPQCHLELPPDYCKTCDEAPPLPIVAIGFSDHGKTHLLAALLLTIEHLTNFPLDVSYLPLGEHTLVNMIDWRDAADQKRKLASTPTVDPKIELIPAPLIVSVKGLYDPRTLLIHDVAGESFQTLKDTHSHLPALRAAQTVWFVVSANDLQFDEGVSPQKNSGRRLGDLFASYLTAMQKLGASPQNRNAIIVLTKGDKLAGVQAAAQEQDWLPEYLRSDPFSADHDGSETLANTEYEQRLEENSTKLERMMRRIPGGGNLITLLKGQRMNIRFCVVSALGADAHHDKLPDFWKRQRVLDPLIWTLSLEKKRAENDSLHLVLDAGADADPVYGPFGGAPLPKTIWQRLAQRREVHVWLLGQSLAAVPPRRPPPDARPVRPRPRLIGPLLENLPPKSRVIVITQGVILDVEDFRSTDWTGRLLLISTSDNETVVNCWDRPHTVVFRSEQDLDFVISQVQRMF